MVPLFLACGARDAGIKTARVPLTSGDLQVCSAFHTALLILADAHLGTMQVHHLAGMACGCCACPFSCTQRVPHMANAVSAGTVVVHGTRQSEPAGSSHATRRLDANGSPQMGPKGDASNHET